VGCPKFTPKTAPLTITTPSNTPVRLPTPLTTSNGIRIQLAVLLEYTFRTHRPTDGKSDRSIPITLYTLCCADRERRVRNGHSRYSPYKIVPIGEWGHFLTLILTSDDLKSHIVMNGSSTSNIIPSFIEIGRSRFLAKLKSRDSINRRKFKNPAKNFLDILV